MPHKNGNAIVLWIFFVASALAAFAQSGSVGSVRGTVADPSGAVIPHATLTLNSPATGLNRTALSDEQGLFEFANVPFHSYRLTAAATGFAAQSHVVELRSAVGLSLKLVLDVAGTVDTVKVEAEGDLADVDSTFHTDVDRDSFAKLPLESESSSLSSLVTLSTPGVAADSNGLFHGLGDHASNSFSVDGQSITDQQSKVFSNQIPSNSIQSLEVISGAPPAEYGGKTSLVIVATTRSGQDVTRPTGSLNTSYGSFGSATAGFDLAYGGKSWGNFIETDGLNTGRFLDPPEFQVFHDKGNELNLFDRMDRAFSQADSVHVDLNYSRSWFQTPNSFDNVNVSNVVSGGATSAPLYGLVGNADQHSRIETFNISPTYTRALSNTSVLNAGAFVRKDFYNYYPSGNPLADLGPANLQTATVAQERTLTNAAIHADLSYAHGAHTFKAGAQYGQTILRENDSLSIVSNLYNAPCVDANGTPVAGYAAKSDCAGAGLTANNAYLSVLAPYDFTRGDGKFLFVGRGDVKETALFVEDQIKKGAWNFNVGLRGDMYNGLTKASQAEPRVGIAYSVKKTATILRVSYARTLETPFNENLVLSSEGCANAVLAPLLSCTAGVAGTLNPGYRNEFHAGLQQSLGPHLVVSGEYIWKYTHNSFDFSVLGNTPITFPIDWHNSKIPGYALHVEVPTWHNLSAYAVMSSVSARFFPPQVAGAGATVGQAGLPFRIDHDEKFNQTTHAQYTLSRGKWTSGVWGGFNWRYDSGLVAGSMPYATDTTTPVDLSGLTNDQQAQAGIVCGGVAATLAHGFTSCAPADYRSTRIALPAPGTENDDKNPPRIAQRNLFDASLGKENLFHADRYKINFDVTAVNVTNLTALYNFLSTFSGTHFVSPRSMTAKLTLNF